MTADTRISAIVKYEDDYVDPLVRSALQKCIPTEVLVLIDDIPDRSFPSERLLQWRQYESIDFESLMSSPSSCLANSYIIRKALIRKHYLSTTTSHWLIKHPKSILNDHIKPSVEFEVDYAEFLDDALLEAYELKESWARNAALETETGREWWILKPGMSDRGQGIRLFSSEEELQAIFEEWDPPSDDENEDDDQQSAPTAHDGGDEKKHANGIVTSHLRHFVAQPYVHQPLLLLEPHSSAGKKFHVRTYVIAFGALKVFVYKPMLALFAGESYVEPSRSASPNDNLSSHLTNTCLQNGQRKGSVHSFWKLPLSVPSLSSDDWREDVFSQICSITSEVFEAAARSMSIHFQPLPNAFEIFGLDFLVDAQGGAWLLEVNAFPDFAQTGHELNWLIQGLFENVVQIAVKPFFGLDSPPHHGDDVRQVLDIDLGRR